MVDFGHPPKLLAGVVTVAGLNNQPLLLCSEADPAKSGVCFVRRITQAVLVPQFLFQARVDLLDR